MPKTPEMPLTPAQLVAVGLNHHHSGRFAEAKEAYLQVLAAEPENFDALHLLGVLAHQVGKHDLAAELIEKAVKQNAENPIAFNNLGEAYKGLKRLDEAERCYRSAIALNPGFVEVYSNLGNALKEQGRPEEAAETYRQALALKPDFVLVQYNLGSVLKDLGEFEEAEAAFSAALALKPEYPEAADNLAQLQLLRGEYQEGLKYFEHKVGGLGAGASERVRKVLGELKGKRLWRGESLMGQRLLLVTDPGAGDNIMMMRYLPLLQDLAPARVAVYSTPHLARLFQGLACVDQVIPMTRPLPVDGFDLYTSMMSLPYHFRTTLDTVPDSVPYLELPEEVTGHWRSRLEELPGVKVGLAWAAGKLSPTYKRRSIALERFMPLLDLGEVQLVNLQKGKEADQLKGLGWDFFDPMSGCRDFLDTAGLIGQLDLVISVDTAVAHLAGALGKPVWLLNRYESEWRWMLEREDCRWYPTMRIFRQKTRGDWDPVVKEVAFELERFAKR